MIMSLFRRAPKNNNRKIVDALYASVISAARQPELYRDWGVPDTPLGRYESIGLHMILLLHRMRDAAKPADELAQDILDEFFKDVDHSIRELGVGDPGVPKRMKKLARMFYGRMGNYWSALDSGDADALGDAVARNIAPDAPHTVDRAAIAEYMMRAARLLADVGDAELLAGVVRFPQPVVLAQD
ncbi:MAG: ubiquinol-cytochrome C chaperone family protein [Oricola sp.]